MDLPITRPRRRNEQRAGDLPTLTTNDVFESRVGDDVVVAVLDTWPMIGDQPALKAKLLHYQNALRAHLIGQGVDTTAGEGERILKRFDWASDFVDTGLITGLIQNFYDDFATPGDPRCSHLPCVGDGEEPEEMPDHGLFIADLIDQIAPSADLRVYRVLNDWGVGDLRTVAKALEQAIKDAVTEDGAPRPLVINLSLGVCPQLLALLELIRTDVADPDGGSKPITGAGYALQKSKEWNDLTRGIMQAQDRPDGDAMDANWNPLDDGPTEATNGAGTVDALAAQGLIDSQEPNNLTYAGILKAIDILFRGQSLPANVLLVAAAGNDSCPGMIADPRLPAAIEGVIGVSAALPAGVAPLWRHTSYSNSDDIASPDDGVAAFSGDVDVSGTSDGAAVALYVADERGGVNDFGLAQWSGTSFAAPLVSAYAAAIWAAARRGGDVDADGVLEAIIHLPNKGGRRLVPLAPRAP